MSLRKIKTNNNITGKLYRVCTYTKFTFYNLPTSQENCKNYKPVDYRIEIDTARTCEFLEHSAVVMATGRVASYITSFKQFPEAYYEILFNEKVGWVSRRDLRSAKSWKPSKIISNQQEPDVSNYPIAQRNRINKSPWKDRTEKKF